MVFDPGWVPSVDGLTAFGREFVRCEGILLVRASPVLRRESSKFVQDGEAIFGKFRYGGHRIGIARGRLQEFGEMFRTHSGGPKDLRCRADEPSVLSICVCRHHGPQTKPHLRHSDVWRPGDWIGKPRAGKVGQCDMQFFHFEV